MSAAMGILLCLPNATLGKDVGRDLVLHGLMAEDRQTWWYGNQHESVHTLSVARP